MCWSYWEVWFCVRSQRTRRNTCGMCAKGMCGWLMSAYKQIDSSLRLSFFSAPQKQVQSVWTWQRIRGEGKPVVKVELWLTLICNNDRCLSLNSISAVLIYKTFHHHREENLVFPRQRMPLAPTLLCRGILWCWINKRCRSRERSLVFVCRCWMMLFSKPSRGRRRWRLP